MVYQDRLEVNLLQLFVHAKNSEWISIISAIFLRSTLFPRKNKDNW